ncbi:MAG: flippase [Salinigranum sp.]
MPADSNDLLALLSSSALVVLGVAFSSVSRLLERIIIARTFSPAVYGEVTLGIAIMTIGTSVSLVGLNEGVPRYVSRFEDQRDVRGVWSFGLLMALCTSLVLSGILLANVGPIVSYLFDDPSSGRLLRLFIFTIPLNVVLLVGVGTLRGMENTRYKLYAKDLLRPGSRLLLLFLMLSAGMSLLAVGYAYMVATLVGIAVTYLFVNRLVTLIGPVQSNVRELITYSAPLIVTMLLTVLLAQTDTLMLGYFRSSNEVGLYNAAYPLANSLFLFVSAFGYLYLPQASRLDAEGRRQDVTDIYQVITKWGYVVTFPAFLAFIVFPKDIITMFFGADYTSGGIALALLSFGFFTSAALGRNRSTLSAFGYTTYILAADIVTIVTNVVLNLALIPAYGFVGAAVASTAAYIARNVIVSMFLYVKFDISPFSRATVRTYAVLPAVLIPLSFIASRWISLTSITLLPFLVVAGIAGIVLVSATGSLQPEDAVIVEFVENRIGVEVPYVHSYLPSGDATPFDD